MATEINKEALQALTKADIAAIITLYKLYPQTTDNAAYRVRILTKELERRLEDVFVK